MYLHEAMRQPDKDQFLKAMIEEVESQRKNGHWKIIPCNKVPQGDIILPMVWSMKRKRRIATREVYKWKARLTLHGGKQIHGVHYWETYAPVAQWPIIRFLLTLALLNRWHTRQVDYVLAYPQADIRTDNVYTEIPKAFESIWTIGAGT